MTLQTASSDQPPDADNTGRNVRDRDDRTRTPTDQGNSDADRGITAHIRKEIVANDSLSTNAHNVKIITTDGIVTLRGPVKTSQEKAAVAAAAQQRVRREARRQPARDRAQGLGGTQWQRRYSV